MKNTIKAVCVIIGTIIGAGFASGKEICLFFNIYGIKGLVGIVVASILTGLIIYKVLIQVRNMEAKNYNEYLKQLRVKPKIREVFNIIINIFLLMSFYIMITGFCAYFKQEFNIATTIVATIVCFMCYITFLNHIEGVTKINTILIPFLILMIILIVFKVDFKGVAETSRIQVQKGWFLSSLEYASYNSILLIPMLIGLRKYVYRKEKLISIITSVVFSGLAIILYGVLQTGGIEIHKVDLPLIYIVNRFGNIYKYIYGIVIVSAIYTSAIAAGYGFAENCSKRRQSYKKICMVICITAIPISKIGFSYLVNMLYPVFGLLGLIQLIYILCIKRLEKNDEN